MVCRARGQELLAGSEQCYEGVFQNLQPRQLVESFLVDNLTKHLPFKLNVVILFAAFP